MKGWKPSKWVKVNRFQGLLYHQIWKLWVFITLNFCLLHLNRYYSMILIRSSLLFDVKDVQKNLKKSKFKKDKIRSSATNGEFELVVYRSTSRTYKVVDASTCHPHFYPWALILAKEKNSFHTWNKMEIVLVQNLKQDGNCLRCKQ